jgi:outer membrane protein OmpA-like peptidoglycan-associated protein
MSPRSRFPIFGLLVALMLALPTSADAQFGKITKAAKKGAEDEAAKQVEKAAADAVACAFNDLACIEKAEDDGEQVVLLDSEGRVITDEDGYPITDPEKAAAAAGEGTTAVKPGEGVWSNYDYTRGDKILFAEDFEDDRVGNFPKRLEFVKGNMEVVEWEGRRLVRSTAGTLFDIYLPEALPERFTVEFDLNNGAAHMLQRLFTSVPESGLKDYPGNWFKFNSSPGVVGNGPESTTHTFRIREQLTTIRIQVDGRYAKVYLDEERVANIPNAELPRSDVLRFEITGSQDNPTYFGNIIIAAGGMELYDVLLEQGRVATQGIFFDVNSDVIRPESGATLEEIGTMLQQHEEMRIAIEGHTDSQGADDYNLELSERRAAAVVVFLVAEYDISGDRLESAGFGETVPAASNDTKEGRQQNRRVELVLLD